MYVYLSLLTIYLFNVYLIYFHEFYSCYASNDLFENFFLTISQFILRENSIKNSIPILHEFSILKKKNIIQIA